MKPQLVKGKRHQGAGCHTWAINIVLWLALVAWTESFSIEQKRLLGIWKLKTDHLPYEQDIRSQLLKIFPEMSNVDDGGLLLKLNPDGSFKQCNEGYQEGRWMTGRWELQEGNQLMLAMRRQYYGPRFDVLLSGRILEDPGDLQVHGDILTGKYVYPHKHPAFFENCLANEESIGPFVMEQTLSTYSIVPSVRVQDPDRAHLFQASDFYDRQFILTVEPMQSKVTSKDNFLDETISNQPFDLRSMPIQFFRNNTFQALGVNKILRGRFSIGESGDRLEFDVSLFGMGRSTPGSVYSEGLGLTHEDERSYVGSIQESQGKLFVDGSVTFGNDMGSDAHPEPVGTFLLTEVSDNNILFSADQYDNSVFE